MDDNEETGRARGGRARADVLPPEQRREIAKKAALARWDPDVPQATHGSPEKPLRIGDLEIPCYVLSDGRRVLHQRGMVSALGMSRGGSSRGGGDRLAHFVAQKTLRPYVSKGLVSVTADPIRFRTPAGANAYGYEATVLADICDAILEARKAGALSQQQEHLAAQAEILVRGFARVGIIALVDEATGYQRDRAANALAKILEAFIAKELRPWIKTFPDEFYEQLFRLRGLEFPRDSVKRPSYFGYLTNDIIYRRLAPGVLKELREITPKYPSGRRKHTFVQRLTEDVGHPKLLQHLSAVVAVMKLSDSYDDFIAKLDRTHPRYGETPMLPFNSAEAPQEGI